MSQRRTVVGLAVAASTVLLGACGFQSPAVTNQEHNSIQGHDFSVGHVGVRNAHITNELGSAGGAKSYLVVTLINSGTAKASLTGITSTAGTVTIAGQGVFNGSIAIPPKGVPVLIQEPLASPTGPTAEIVSSSTPSAGTYVPLTFSFGSAGTSPAEQIPVVPSSETTASTTTLPTEAATPPPITGDQAND